MASPSQYTHIRIHSLNLNVLLKDRIHSHPLFTELPNGHLAFRIPNMGLRHFSFPEKIL